MSLIPECLHKLIFTKPSIFGMITPYIDPYLLTVGIKGTLGSYRLVGCDNFLEMQVDKITVVIQ